MIILSVNYLRLIPESPTYIPNVAKRRVAEQYLKKQFPQIESIEFIESKETLFVDSGSNWETIRCPVCEAELCDNWWKKSMDSAYENRFSDLNVSTPCCGSRTTLNDLNYNWPAGFARFIVEIRNPPRDITGEEITELDGILDCRLRKVWAHY